MSKTYNYETRMEARKELERLQERAAELRKILTPQAIMAVWLLLGDDMWAKEEQ